MTSLTCGKCGWVHFGVSREYARLQVRDFNKYYQSLSRKTQLANYGGEKASIKSYEQCFRCTASYKTFKPATDEDFARSYGSTINPIIHYVSKK